MYIQWFAKINDFLSNIKLTCILKDLIFKIHLLNSKITLIFYGHFFFFFFNVIEWTIPRCVQKKRWQFKNQYYQMSSLIKQTNWTLKCQNYQEKGTAFEGQLWSLEAIQSKINSLTVICGPQSTHDLVPNFNGSGKNGLIYIELN